MLKRLLLRTESGSTAVTISKYRPHSDIAVTPSEHTARQLALVWGAYPVIKKGRKTTDDLLNNAVVTKSRNWKSY